MLKWPAHDRIGIAMRYILPLLLVGSLAVGVAGCATVTLAPGADQLRLTRVPADVAGCAVAGNIQLPRTDKGFLTSDPEAQFRNTAVGLGANTVLVTEASSVDIVPLVGVGYRCP